MLTLWCLMLSHDSIIDKTLSRKHLVSSSFLDCMLLPSAGFMVPVSAFGSGANQINITESSFDSCQSSYGSNANGCSLAAYGACTQV